MDIYSTKPTIVSSEDYKKHTLAVFETEKGAVCCNTQHEWHEHECLVCGESLLATTVYFAQIDGIQLSGYCDTADEAADRGRTYIDREAAKPAPKPVHQLTGITPPKAKDSSGKSTADAGRIAALTVQAGKLGMNMQLASLLGLQVQESRGDRLPMG